MKNDETPPANAPWLYRRVTMPDASYQGQVRAWHVGTLEYDEGLAAHEMTISARQFRAHPALYSHWLPVAPAPTVIADEMWSMGTPRKGSTTITADADTLLVDLREGSEARAAPALRWVLKSGADISQGEYVIQVRNYGRYGSTSKENTLAGQIANYLNDSSALEQQLRSENQRLRDALGEITDIVFKHRKA